MNHNSSYWADSIINKFRGFPIKSLCTSANLKECLVGALERYGKIRFNQGIREGRRVFALEIKRKTDYPDEYNYQVKRWVETAAGKGQ